MPKGITRRTDLNSGLGINFSDNFRLQDGLVANRGQTVIHELGITCTCRTTSRTDTVVVGSGNMNCSRCENGILYRDSKQIIALITSISYQRQLLEEGLVSPGDCLMSVAPNSKRQPSDFDRITFTWAEPVSDGQVIHRGVESETRDGLESNEDILNYAVANVLHCEDEDGKIYYQDSDFRTEGRRIIWSNPPEIRKRYSIKYQGYISWIVFTPPHSRRDGSRSMGSRIMLRKSHIVNMRGPIDTNIIDDSVFMSRKSV
jgi:hypothetical protein